MKAPACGTVIFAEHNVPLSGHLLVLDHGHGLSSSFLHLHTFAVKVGAEVKQGDIIGRVGMTGRTNGAHLDWRSDRARRLSAQVAFSVTEIFDAPDAWAARGHSLSVWAWASASMHIVCT